MIIKILSEKLSFNKEILIHDKRKMPYVFRGLIFLAFLICIIYPVVLIFSGIMTDKPADVLLCFLPALTCVACDQFIRLKRNTTAWLFAFVILPLTIMAKFNYKPLNGLQFFSLPLAIACFFVVRKKPHVFSGFIFSLATFFEMNMVYDYRENSHFQEEYPLLILANLLFAFTLFFLLLYIRNLIDNYHRERTKNAETLASINTKLSSHNQQIIDQLELLSKKNNIITGAAIFHRKITSLISHDVRSAIVPIRYLLNLYQKGAMEKKDFDGYILRLQDEVEHLHTLFEDMLTLSSRQDLKSDDLKSRFALSSLVDDICRDFTTSCDEKKIVLQKRIAEHIYLYTHAGLLKITIRNLLSNAIKFSHPSGVVKISAAVSGSEVRIAVTDKGVGINSENIAKLLNGGMVQTKGTLNERGAGLGLGFCKDFIVQLGGQLAIESRTGQGATFSFVLPLQE